MATTIPGVKPLIAVVTHINPLYKRDITRCANSVQAAIDALPLNPLQYTHQIIECSSIDKLSEARISALDLAEFVVFVDDDDFIAPDSLLLCLKAIQTNDYGVAFTREVALFGNKIVPGTCALTYNDAIKGPRIIHHLSMIRTNAVTTRGKELAREISHATEWVLKISAGFNKGIIHIPKTGYFWQQHKNQIHRIIANNDLHNTQMQYATEEINKWSKPTGKIDVFKI